jgi:hypothetical protein
MRAFRVVGVGVLAILAAACQQSKSANPLSPDIAGPIPGVSISAPRNLEPFVGQQIEATQQPLNFLIENPSSSGVRPLKLQFQLASDANFQQVVHQADQLGPGENGRTAYRLPETLGAGGTYHWRVRALDGANTGPYSTPSNFALTEPVVIDPPQPLEPVGQIATVAPVFKVQNGRISGPAGPVIYRIEVGVAPDPGQIAVVLSTGVGSGATTSVSGGNAPHGTILYWRAYGTDGVVQSAYSPWAAFRTPDAPAAGGGGGGGGGPVGGGGGGGGTVGGARSIGIDEALSIIRGVHDGLRANLGSGSSRDSRNAFWASAVATIHYGHSRFNPKGPDSDWCIKDGGNGRPQSDDVLVRCGSREAWDMVGGAGGNGYSFHTDYIGRLPGDQNVYPPPRSALP